MLQVSLARASQQLQSIANNNGISIELKLIKHLSGQLSAV
jgi:hypothetical protein